MSIFGNKTGRGIVAALESENDDAAVVEAPLDAENAETAMVEATSVGADIDAGLSEVEATEADAETLGEIADTVEASEETGGLDPVAAEVTQVAVEAIYARLGISNSKQPALEGFADVNNRVKETKISVEDIREKLKTIWDAIINAFNKIKQWVSNFIAAIIDANERLAQRADALEKKARATKGTPKEADMPAGNLGSALGTGGGFDKGEVIKTIAGFPAMLEGLAGGGTRPKLAGVIKNVVQDQGKFDGYKLAAGNGGAGYKASDEGAGEGLVWLTSTPLAGGKVIKLKVAGSELSGEAAFAAMAQYDAKLADASNAAGNKTEKVPVLSTDEAAKIAAAARGVSKAVINLKKYQSSLEAEITSLTSDARSAATLAPKDEDGAAKRSQLVGKAISGVIKFSIKEAQVGAQYATTVVKAALDYAEKSLAQYQEAKADDKDAKK